MKLKIAALLMAAGLASSVYGQGVILNNIGFSGGLNATSGGQVYLNGVLADLFNNNVGVTVLGGPNSGSLTTIGTFTQGNDPKGYTGADFGQFELGTSGAAVNIPNVAAGALATIQLQMWYNGASAGGLFANYAAAASGGGFVGTVTFQNPTSNPGGAPPVPAGKLTGMPSINLVAAPVPEPTTLALAGLGAASLLIFRRRK